ncbi:hypothetical protein Agub_g10605 [Astrephomene gubernaculifera]|uniref:Protochlorophyllide reductase n=1 Tax=Astrephomene gubernaculifera TaxID=47775 RepID=A0AAD3HPZ1_9CHLO|nr:hypothetical protein Agub_g10605 [Astrephomene gubernaculifera]
MVVAQRVLITGGNSGIGFEAARQLLQLGHHVVIACRDAGKAQKAVEALAPVAKASGVSVDSALMDLTSFASVRDGAAKLLARHPRLDVMVCNAGVMSGTRGFAAPQLTADGYETTLQVNHLSHFLLVHLLLPALLASPAARVVVVSSELHRKALAEAPAAAAGAGSTPGSTAAPAAPKGPDVGLATPEWLTRLRSPSAATAAGAAAVPAAESKRLSGMQLYCISKLYNLWFAFHLASLLPSNVTCNAVSPGWVPGTALGRGAPWLVRVLYQTLCPLIPFAVSVPEGARRVVSVCVGADEGAVRGRYFARGAQSDSSSESLDTAAAAELWKLSMQATGVEEYLPPQQQPQGLQQQQEQKEQEQQQ